MVLLNSKISPFVTPHVFSFCRLQKKQTMPILIKYHKKYLLLIFHRLEETKLPAIYLLCELCISSWLQSVSLSKLKYFMQKKYSNLHFGPIFAMVCPDIGIALSQSSKNKIEHIPWVDCDITQASSVLNSVPSTEHSN